jgi:cell division protein FtsI/penicillin-binding protein 2
VASDEVILWLLWLGIAFLLVTVYPFIWYVQLAKAESKEREAEKKAEEIRQPEAGMQITDIDRLRDAGKDIR